MERPKNRVVFMGSPGFAVPSLERLAADGYEVAAVYTPPDRPAGRGRALVAPPVKEAARRLGLEVAQPESLKDTAAIDRLARLKPEVIVVCAYGQILPPAVLELPPYGCLNLHPSLLPEFRGAAPVAAALLAGEDFTGASIMLLDEGMDTGPVLCQAAVAVSPRDNTGTLTEKLALVGADLLQEALTGWRRGEIAPRSQDEAKATYCRQVKKEDGKIDWSEPAEQIARQVRAYNPWPGCYTRWRGKQLKILEAVPLSGEGSAGSGRVVARDSAAALLGVGTGEGMLCLLQLQLEGKKAMTAAAFRRGQPGIVGAVLPDG